MKPTIEATSVADVSKLLLEAVAQERAIENELGTLVASISDVEDGLLSLLTSTKGALEEAKIEAEQLEGSTAKTAALADQVSCKIRELDGAQSRVNATLERINILLERSEAVNGVQAALDQGDYETATKYVARYLELEEQVGGAETAKLESGQLAVQTKAMDEARSTLEAKIRALATEAMKAQDEDAVARFACMFGPLRRQDGCSMLVEYLRAQIKRSADVEYDRLVDAGLGSNVDHLGALTRLFSDVAGAIEKHVDVIKAAFGPEVGVSALLSLHAECDAAGTRIVQRYKDYRALPRIARQISMRRRDDSAVEAAPVEPRQIELFLNELIALHGRGEEYTQYLLMRMVDVSSPQQLPPSEETALRSGALSAALRELLSYYISLEEYYIEESLAKAIRIDESAEGALTSSVVDDAFFVLQGAGRRAMATGRVPAAVAILNQMNAVLSTMYRSALTAKLQNSAARLAAAHPAATEFQQQQATVHRAQAAVTYNNAEVSATYLQKLRQQLEGLASSLFTVENDKARISLVLADLGKTATDYKQITSRALEQLCSSVMPRLQPVLDEIVNCSYQLADSEYLGAGGWPHDLLVAVDVHIRWLQPLLTVANFDGLVHAVIDKIVARLEAAIAQKRFTQIGGLQLERDVRVLVSGLSEFTSRTVRDKFARISQIATVLGLETIDEAADLVADGSAAWRLTDADIRQALAQRVEFEGRI